MSEAASYTVPGMHCGHCRRAVSEELSAGDETDALEGTEELLAAVQPLVRTP